jgi:hypothetical protein
MRKTIFYNTNPVAISTRLNEYMKSNFGYEIESDLQSLREAKSALEAQKRSMSTDMQDRAYVENMLMLETVRSLLKAHVAEGELPPALKAYQDKKKKKAGDKEDKVEEKAKPDFADIDGDGDKKEPMKKAAKDAKKKKVDESEERPYVCVHAKKGKHECKAKSSYEAAKKAATHWKMKSTAGIDAHLADKEKVAEGFKIRDKSRGYGVSDKTYKTHDEAKKAAVMKAASTGSEWEVIKESDTPKFDTNTKKYDNSYEAPKEYKMKKEKLEEGLLAQLNALLEGDAAEAEITMAARGIVDELQDMIEKLGKIQNDQLGPLADEMAYSHGADQSASFKGSVDQAIAGLLDNARQTKEAVNNAVLTLTGQAPASDMGAGDMELGGDMTADMEDDITADVAGADDSMAGPADEPLGRAKRAD